MEVRIINLTRTNPTMNTTSPLGKKKKAIKKEMERFWVNFVQSSFEDIWSCCQKYCNRKNKSN